MISSCHEYDVHLQWGQGDAMSTLCNWVFICVACKNNDLLREILVSL